MFFERFDAEPVIDATDPAVVEPLRARALAALSRR